ncbi:MAG: hypothetical protein WC107_07400 [Patescibacteria group bacterium]
MRESIEHIWARNEDPEYHKKQGNMSFEGLVAYSWSTVVAVKYPDKKRDHGTCVMVDDGIRNSGYTMRHKSHYRCALPHDLWTFVHVDVPAGGYYGCSHANELKSIAGIRECYKYMLTLLAKKAKKVKEAKAYSSRACAWVKFAMYLRKTNEVAVFLKLKQRTAATYKLNAAAEEANSGRWNASVAARPAARRRSWEDRHPRIEETPENIELWRNRELSYSFLGWQHTYVRFSKDGTNVETSRGAVVPVDAARALFAVCQLVRDGRRDAASVPRVSVGNYTLHSVQPNGDCTVGCHFLAYDEMEQLYKKDLEKTA